MTTPPRLYNHDAERGLIAAMMTRTDLAHLLALPADAFNDTWYAAAWRAMQSLAATGQPLTLATVGDALDREDASESYRLTQVLIHEPDDAEACAAIVRKFYLQRKHLQASVRYAQLAISQDPHTTAQMMLSDLLALMGAEQQQQTVRPYHDVLSSYLDRLEDRVRHPERALRSGFRDLDATVGALEPGSLILLAGRPGQGKSALAGAINRRAAATFKQRGKGAALYVTLEMPPEDIAERLIAARGPIDTTYLRAGLPLEDGSLDERTYHDVMRFAGEEDEATHGHLFLTSGASVATDHLYGLSMQIPDLELLTVDYVDLLSEPGKDEYQRLSAVSWKLKQLAMRRKCVVLALVQISRGVEGRDDKRPTMADLRGTGRFEQDADLILGIYRPSEYYGSTPHDPQEHAAYPYFAEALILKHRKGKGHAMVPLLWVPEAAQYDDFPHHRYSLDKVRESVALKEGRS